MYETLTEMFDRIINTIWNQGGMHWEWSVPDITPQGIETNVGRMDSSTDVGVFLRDQRPKVLNDMPVGIRRKLFDKGAMATGGIIERRPDTIV